MFAKQLMRGSMQQVITFIGAGNLARSLIGGLIKNNYPSNKILATRRDPNELSKLKLEFDICGFPGVQNDIAVRHADVVVLGVKPMQVQEVLRQISETVQHTKPLFISLAAGVLIKDMQRWLDYEASIVRSMSNTPALISLGASALYASNKTTAEQKKMAEQILNSVGVTCWVNSEEELNNIMPLVSSGPGYIFLLMKQFIDSAVRMGVAPDVAERMTIQTFYGAGKLAATSTESIDQLRTRVTTPNGVTFQGTEIMQKEELDKVFEKAMRAGAQRGKEFAEMFGKDAVEAPSVKL